MTPMETASAVTYGRPEQADEAGKLDRKQRWFRAFESNKTRELAEQRQARQYYHDRQWTDEEVRRLQKRGQQPTVRNRIKRKIDFLVGVEQRLRRDPKAYPRTPKHEKEADVATAGLRFVCDQNRWERVSSAAMHDGLVSGIGVVFVGIEGQPDNQDPKLKHVPVERFFYDPRSVEPDFSDARYMGLHLWLDVDEAKERWPDHAAKLDQMIDANSASSSLLHDVDREMQWADFEQRRVRLVEFWERRSGGWYYCYFTGSIELESGMSPYTGDKGEPDCPYVAWSPYVDERGDRYGMIRTMKSVQDEINYSASKILHRIATDRFFYEDGSIEDVDELGAQLARPDGKIRITRGEWGKTVGIIDQGAKLQGEAERFQLAIMEIENLGPNPGLVGRGEGVDGASGRALLAQRDSGMTELSPVFERHRDWKLRVYRRLWSRCRQAWRGEKWIRITDEQDAPQFVGLNQYQMAIDPYGMPTLQGENVIAEIDVDIILNEGPDTITVNEELMQTLGSLGEAATGPLGRVMIELSNAPNKERLLSILEKATAPDPQIEAMQKRMAQLEEMRAAAQIDEKRALVENKRADTLAKLITASKPETQQTDEFGQPVGPAPSAPNLPAALAAMQGVFPMHFGEPLLQEQAAMAGAEPPPDDAMGGMPPGPNDIPPGPEGAEGMPPMPGEPMMPPTGAPPVQMPEQLTTDGALPINPGA